LDGAFFFLDVSPIVDSNDTYLVLAQGFLDLGALGFRSSIKILLSTSESSLGRSTWMQGI